MPDFAKSRRLMVDCQLRTFDVTDKAVLAAMDEVPRELFVDAAQAPVAYTDRALAIVGGRAIMLAPMTTARLIQGLDVEPGDRVLVAGCGTGYSSAVLAQMGANVIAIDSDGDIVAAARECLGKAGAAGIQVSHRQIDSALAADEPYQAILLEGGFIVPPQALLDALAENGRLAGIDMTSGAGKAVLYTRTSAGFGRRVLFDASAPIRKELAPEPSFQF